MKKRGHGFKIVQERIYGMVWTEEKEGRNDVIILYVMPKTKGKNKN